MSCANIHSPVSSPHGDGAHWRVLLRSATYSILSLPVLTALLLLPTLAAADDDGNQKASVTVSFGAGLNTAQPGNPANHHVLPRTIEIKAGGTVNFVVAGFHQIFVYLPGTGPEDIVPPAFPPNLFINQLTNTYYVGINPFNPTMGPPGGANPGTPPAPPGIDNGLNRTESVSFAEPGTYLVICNVTPHFNDGMYAFVKVSH
jgi:plastocyanin